MKVSADSTLLKRFSGGISPDRVILHVEDCEIDHIVLRRSFMHLGVATRLQWCRDALDSRAYLSRQGRYVSGNLPAPRPDMILLDLNLPGEDGSSLLRHLKKTEDYASIPVIILSSSANPAEVAHCYALGANAYIVKPLNPKDFETIALSLAQFWLVHAALPPTERVCLD